MYSKLFSVGSLPLTETYSFKNEMGVWKHTTLFSFYSLTKTNYTTKIRLTVQLLEGKKKSLTAISLPLKSTISSKYVFIPVSDSGPNKKNWNLPLPVQFSPPCRDKGQIPHSPGKESSEMSEGCPRGGDGCWGFNILIYSNVPHCLVCALRFLVRRWVKRKI